MDSSNTGNASSTSTAAQGGQAMDIDENMESPGNAPASSRPEQQLTGKPGEAIGKMKKSLEKSKRTSDHIVKSLAFKQESEMLKLKLQKLKELMLLSEALTFLFDVRNAKSHENCEQ